MFTRHPTTAISESCLMKGEGQLPGQPKSCGSRSRTVFETLGHGERTHFMGELRMFTSSSQILDHFRDRQVDPESRIYIKTHAKRYAFLLDVVTKARQELACVRSCTILDIGPSFFTELIRLAFPRDTVLTLGLDSAESRGGHLPNAVRHEDQAHFYFDLNDSQYRDRWIKLPSVDLAVMAEVIEHLYTAPTLVLAFVQSLLSTGGILIVQTPNAATLKKRLKLLFGENPYEMIRENPRNPGHYREYTKRELHEIADAVGFEVSDCVLSNYFSHDSSKRALEQVIRSLVPPNLKRGITLVLRKRG